MGTAGLRLSRTRLNFALAALAVIGAAGCLTDRKPDSVRPQDWWSGRGPVVPHDSFPADCALCHTSENWQEIRPDFHFDHAQETGVPLIGAHAQAECIRCHNDRGPVQMFAARGCAGCHDDIHLGQLGSQCSTCHTEDNWLPFGQVAEHARTRFPLIGAHASTACIECHSGATVGNFTRANIECIACHQRALAQATTPDHQAAGWIDRCDRCHIPTTWQSSGFAHAFFPLTGGHAQPACADCHAGGNFQGAPTACVACHQSDYDATTDPDHTGLAYSTQCDSCHSIASWQGAVFEHSTFPLTGKHAKAACSACHVGGVFVGTPSACIDCHQTDYDTTTDPNHAAAGFPTSCDSCHGTSKWKGATVTHAQFPIKTGKHKGFDCAQCHLNPVDFSMFSCIDCHTHNKVDTDINHVVVAGYSYDSPACYNCHPKGKPP